MADFSMWGAQEDPNRLAEADRWRNVQSGLAAQKILGEIAMQPAEAAQKTAHARLYQAQAQAAEAKAREEQEVQRLMLQAQAQATKQDSVAGMANSVAVNLAKGGFLTKALDISRGAAELGQKAASTEASLARAKESNWKGKAARADAFASLMDGVLKADDPAQQWTRANALYEFQYGERSPWAGASGSPEEIKRTAGQLRDAALSVKEKAELEGREETRVETERSHRRSESQRDAEIAIRNARLGISKDREARLAKEGGGRGVASPSTEDRNALVSMIKKDYPRISDADLLDEARVIASEAKELQRRNRGLGADAARAQAYLKAQRRGDFKTTPRPSVGGVKILFIQEEVKVIGRGLSPATAMKVPESKEGLVEGRYYINASGQVAKRVKGGWLPVAAGLSGDNTAGEGSADDDDEEE